MVAVSTAAFLAATSLACGVLDTARDLVAAAETLSKFADRLGKAKDATFTAEYQLTDGVKVTMVRQPPRSAYLGPSGRVIATPEALYLCDLSNGTWTCQKSTAAVGDGTSVDAGLIAGVGGSGFVTPELALGLIAMAALVPGVQVTESQRTIAGQESLCAEATGLDAAAKDDPSAPRDFSVCITEAGILASFRGTLDTGEQAAVELTSYSPDVDPAVFTVPANAKIIEVDAIRPAS